MNMEQPSNLNTEEKEKEIDVFAKGPAIVGEDLVEENLDEWDKKFIKKNMDLIQRFDTARNQEEASMIYEEAIQTEDRDIVKEVYDFVKTKKQER